MATLLSINSRLARRELGLYRQLNADLVALCNSLEAGLRAAGHVPAVTSEPGFDGRQSAS